jgi:hypothetical protein
MNNLAMVLNSLNRLKEAEELSRNTLRFMKAVHPPNHRIIGTSLNNLAIILQGLNQLKEA